MKRRNNIRIATVLSLAVFAPLAGVSQAQTLPVIPVTYVLPGTAADTNQPGFIWSISEVNNSEPNDLSFAELQLAGLEGANLADPAAVGIAIGPAQAANPATAPISFVIPGVINLSKSDGTSKGNFTPDLQMPGLPGTGPNGSDNAAAEALTYLLLPAGTNTMVVNSDDGFRVTLGGANPLDPFAVNVGEHNGGRGAADTVFQFVVTQPGLYAARLLWENGGGDANVEWFTISDGLNGTNKVLINDVVNGGIPAYHVVTTVHAYAQTVDPAPGATDVVPNEGLHVTVVDGSVPVAQSSISLVLDGTAVSPTFAKNGNVTSVDFSSATPWGSLSQHTASIVFSDGTFKVTNTWSFTVQNYVPLDPGWQVTAVDTNKPGFSWNIFANPDGANTANSNERAENDLKMLAVDANGVILPNLADPAAVGAAVGPGVASTAANGLVHFEIATTISLDIGATNMPGAPSTDGSTDGQAAEVRTYLKLPAGVVRMEVNSDDGWRLYAGAQPADAFGRAVLAEHNDGTGPVQFSFLVSQAGVYPFRMIWENGTGGSHLTWYSFDATGKKALVNDRANGGVPAYRALVAGTTVQPYIAAVTPIPAIHQIEVANTNLTILLADGTHPVDDASVSLTVDGKSITPIKQRQGSLLSVSDGGAAFPGLQLPSDVHTATVTFKDSTGAYSRSQQWTFNNIQILILPATPVVQENFDSYPEATSTANTVPPGWTAWNYTLENTPGWDLTAKDSDSYKNWIIISTDTATSIEGSSLNNDPTQTINGQPVASFASGNVLWATSDGRSGVQAQFCTSAPFNLSSVNNPVLIYSSLMRASGNANAQADGIEYSIDDGKTWLPGVIYVTIAYGNEGYVKLLPDGTIDVNRTLNAPFSVLNWVDPVTQQAGGGTFGSGLAEPVTQALAPYLAPRSQNVATSTKVDGIRLPLASKQKSVRLRFYQLGNCSWWWGVDNLAFYDIAPTTSSRPTIDNIAVAGGQVTVKWSNGGTLESSASLSSPSWTSSGNSSGTFTEPVAAAGNKFYRVRQ
ncbi:MAG: hypothetical protein ACYDH9_07955 [Limisphaerales bacterium]